MFRPHYQNSMNLKEYGIWLGAILLVVVLEWVGLMKPFRTGGEKLIQPIQSKGAELVFSFNEFFDRMTSSYKAAERVQELERDYSQALAEINSFEELKEENQSLKELLSVKDRSQGTLLAATIISYGEPTIAAGDKEGVISGTAVLGAGTLLGVLNQVSAHQSVISLLSDNSIKPILARTESGLEGVIKGDGKKVILTELDRESNVEVGEKVVTAGQEGLEPNLYIGQVQAILTQDSSPVQTVVVEQLVSFYNFRVVEVRL